MAKWLLQSPINGIVVEAYRLDRYDNLFYFFYKVVDDDVVEAYRLDRYDNRHLRRYN